MTRRLTLAALLVLAIAAWFRLHDLGRWSIDSDEFFSLVDVQDLLDGQRPEAVESHPLGFLGMAAMARLFGETEWALRLFPALTGLGAVACLLFLRRDVIGRAAALVAGALAAISPWLIYHAQEARFYGPLLLFATLATLWSLPGPRRAPWRAALCFVAACLCHPSALLLAPGLLFGARRFLNWRRAALLLTAGAVGIWLWISLGEGAVRDVLVRALTLRPTARYDAVHFVAGLGYNLGVGTGLLVLCGAVVALRRRLADDWQLLVCAGLPPLLLFGTALMGVSTQQRYAMAAVPAALLLAGAGWSRLAQTRRALAVGLGVLALLAPVPELQAYAQNGDRHDMRGAARWLAQHMDPGAILVADEHSAIEVYLTEDARFDDVMAWEAPLNEERMFSFVRNKRDVWVVLKANRMSGVYGRDFLDWVDEHFTERARIGLEPPPLVRHENVLIIWQRTARVNDGRGPPAKDTR